MEQQEDSGVDEWKYFGPRLVLARELPSFGIAKALDLRKWRKAATVSCCFG
jgi:hypothetical protein